MKNTDFLTDPDRDFALRDIVTVGSNDSPAIIQSIDGDTCKIIYAANGFETVVNKRTLKPVWLPLKLLWI